MTKTLTTVPVFNDAEEIKKILAQKLTENVQINSIDDFPSPFELLNMDKAVDIFFQTVAENKKIRCICDSDCDGLGTYTLFWNFFKHFPYKNIEFIITNRKEGYGFLPRHVVDGVGLYITSDNGITSNEATKVAKNAGAKVIITDHHQVDPVAGLPEADAVVDPHIPGDTFPYKDISGTFVLWFFLKAIAERSNLDLDLFEEFLPELGLTTISDVMSLDRHLNRFVVTKFTEFIAHPDPKHREYINTFKELVNSAPTSEDIAFSLTPMINATQRMTTADQGALFLIQETSEESKKWFWHLQEVNKSRKKIQQDFLDFIVVNNQKYIKDKPFIVIPARVHKEYKGVLGIAAARLTEKYKKPAIVMNYVPEDNVYTGSGRSVGDLNILDLLRDNPYLKNVGGHKQALGITVEEGKFADFYNTLMEKAAKLPKELLEPKVDPLGFIPLNKIDLDLFNEIKTFEPFGKDFERPLFVTKATVKGARLVGNPKNHLSLTVQDDAGILSFKGMQFFTTDVPEKGKEYLFHFTLALDSYGGGESVMLHVKNITEINE